MLVEYFVEAYVVVVADAAALLAWSGGLDSPADTLLAVP